MTSGSWVAGEGSVGGLVTTGRGGTIGASVKAGDGEGSAGIEGTAGFIGIFRGLPLFPLVTISHKHYLSLFSST